jgi:putative CocE/NonD family hydrolase
MSTRVFEVERTGPAPQSAQAEQHQVRMRDGVRLATAVYLPAGDRAPGPTILVRLPYDKDGAYTFIPQIAARATAHGYRLVAQDVRGKFRSEGETLLFVNEAYDGYDTLDWIEQQDWSDGVVGMWGDSYYGFTQWAAVSSGHPALRAISPRVTGTRLGELPELAPGADAMEVEMSVHRLYPVTHFHSRDSFAWEVDWSARPYVASVERFLEAVGERSASWDAWWPHAVRLRRFPNGSPFDARPVPCLMTIGWWDNCAPWQWGDHAELARRPAWALNEYLLIDAIDHENFHLTRGERAAERSPAEQARIVAEVLDPTLQFFDVFLRGLGPADAIPRVRWNLAHTEGLRTAPAWPPPGTEPWTLLATADGRLVPEEAAAGGNGAGPALLRWVHDPDDLVPSPATDPFSFLAESPDERAWATRDDVLVFNAPPVAAPLDLVGAVDLAATAGSDGPAFDLFARLLDVAPDGSAHLIARGQLHVPRCAGEHDLRVDLGQVGYRLRTGHHLRLHVASSDFPEFVPQPGTGESPWSAVEVRRNEQTLRAGARLTFSVLPA